MFLSKEKKKKLIAQVFITPKDSTHEFPTPLPFFAPHTREFVENYANECRRRLGQTVRIVWKKTRRR